MEFKGTPAPWTVADKTTNGTQGFEIHYSYDGECITDHVYTIEDAHLIASAPELLEALKETEKDLCVLWGQMIDIAKTNPLAEGMPDLIQTWRSRNKRAISKALNLQTKQ